ncbi:MAG: hypothetical protein A2V98_23695 [Planctomycetes bacterium RBG_16_64_12]|nr:MAG: hypothetical protein A2V98_23695 [Planctomycetes bacterium RBG_16_64_12]
MQTAKQLSVSLVNKPGRLAAMLAALNKGKVNFRALVVMDSGDRGTVRFVPDEFAAATEVLDKINIRYDVADVLLVDIPKQSGAFRNLCERLAADHLNIDYAYMSFAGPKGAKGGSLAVIRVNDLSKAQRVLSENGSARRRKKPQPGRRPPTRVAR